MLTWKSCEIDIIKFAVRKSYITRKQLDTMLSTYHELLIGLTLSWISVIYPRSKFNLLL
jgi:hypothetical protein